MINDLLHTLCYTFVSILALTTGNPVYLMSSKAHGGCDRLAKSSYSYMTHDHNFVFVGVRVALHSFNILLISHFNSSYFNSFNAIHDAM
jgi:hypothetical protein